MVGTVGSVSTRPSGPADRARRTARITRIGAVALLLVGAVSLAALSLVPYETLRAHVASFSVDGDAGLDVHEFDRFVVRLRLLSAGFVALSVGLVLARNAVDRATTGVIADWSSALRRAPGLLVAWSRRQGVVYVAALALVLLAGVVVRAVYLDGPMRYDEATTYDNYVSKPLYVSLANYSTPNNHLLNTALAAVSVTIGGSGPAAVRAPAFVAGVLVVVAAFAAAWRRCSPRRSSPARPR